MRLLVFGQTGQVARALARLCEVRKVRADFLARSEAELIDPAACAEAIGRSGADFVVNAAAFTAVDRAEKREARALVINGEAPAEMAAAAKGAGVPFLHISTDYVFDGTGGKALEETARALPINAYGRTKLAGERGVAEVGGQYVILRTACVYSGQPGNFVSSIYRAACNQQQIEVVCDQTGGPTRADQIAGAIMTIAHAFDRRRGVSGLFHFAGAPPVSRADLARRIIEMAGFDCAVRPISSSSLCAPARRPAHVALDCRKIAALYGIGQPDWRETLGETVKMLEAGR